MASMLRRRFLQTTLASGVGAAALARSSSAQQTNPGNPLYIAAYDTESPSCLDACKKIVEMHKRHEMPATFFIVGKTLQANPVEYRKLLDDPLFEIASHTYSHRMLRDNPFCGSAISLEDKRIEIFKGKKIIEDVFERPCLGMRPGCGFEHGFKNAKDVLGFCEEAGYLYTSSMLWGPDYSLPTLLNMPFTYAENGFPDLWELPGHGWHENLLKNNNKMGPKRITLWPPAMPEAIPKGYITTPQEEFAINKIFFEKTLSQKKTYISLIWHPWSLHQFDPEMKMLDLTFSYIRKNKFTPATYAGLHQKLA